MNFPQTSARFFPSLLPQTSPGDTLIVIFLRGAADGLNIALPFGDSAYYALRPTLGIPRPDDPRAAPGQRAFDLDGFFGFHPSLKGLIPAWKAGQLAVVQACGAPDESRSHFKAQELMERGVQDENGPASGWIGRLLAQADTAQPSPLRAVGVGRLPQRSLTGPIPVTALRTIEDFHFGGSAQSNELFQSALAQLWAGQAAFDLTGQETLKMVHSLKELDSVTYQSAAPYPDTDFGNGLKQVAMLLKARQGMQAAALDLNGWDTHFAQGGSSGQMANLIEELGDGLAAFWNDCQAEMGRVSLVVMTEFGRRAAENGSLGTDHGHGSLMLLLGGGVKGGKVYGRWPGLQPEQLDGPGDLAVTTDYRDVIGEVCVRRLGLSDANQVFPGYSPTFPGILAPLT
jgi:uncharacterized protein (DUF1501 family)